MRDGVRLMGFPGNAVDEQGVIFQFQDERLHLIVQVLVVAGNR